MKEREVQMMGKIEMLENQLEMYKRKAISSPKNVGSSEQDRWKKSYN